MAKQQTFVDKSNKRGADTDKLTVKVIVVSKTEKGTYRFNKKLVKVKDINEVEQIVRGE